MSPRQLARELAAILAGAGVDEALFEAELIVRHAAGLSRVAYLTGDTIEPAAAERARALAQQRATRTPLAYLVGQREFYGLPFLVTPDVLIPRPETEALVEAALAEARTGPAIIADIGTGSGCVATAIAVHCPTATVVAVDRSAAALRVARTNAATNSATVRFLHGNLTDMLGRADIVVANLPYIPSARIATLEPEVRDHEPHLALDGGRAGLDLIAQVIADCGQHLRPRLLALETDSSHAQEAATLARQQGASATVQRDLAGHERYVMARWDQKKGDHS